MLVEFRVRNFRSFCDDQVLNLVASSDKTLPSNTIDTLTLGKQKLLRSVVVYGPNASGKSNLLNAIAFIRAFVVQSDKLDSDTEIPVLPFLLDAACTDGPTEFELTFISHAVRYQYGISVDRHRVHQEWLIAYPKKLPQLWFERTLGADGKKYDWYFGSKLLGDKKRLESLTRPDTLFLTIAARFGHPQLSPIYSFFRRSMRFMHGGRTIRGNVEFTARRSLEDKKFHSYVKQLLFLADLGIQDFAIEEKASADDVPVILSADTPALSETGDGQTAPRNNKQYEVTMRHGALGGSPTDVSLPFGFESLGTQRLFAMAGPIIDTLEHGYSLFVDELDASLHPILMRAIIVSVQG